MPSARPAYEVLTLSARSLPAVLRGELRGEEALFGPTTLGLWFEYFSNANPHYAPNNAITGLAVARAAAAGASVLEFGGGSGSAAQAVLAALAAAGLPPGRFVFTELQPAFLRRGTRRSSRCSRPGASSPPCASTSTSTRQPGARARRFDVVFGVNTAHLAHDLLATLSNLRGLLRPGGALVLGELLRPGPDAAVHLELPFTLLEAYRHAPLVPGIRPRPAS